MKNALKEIFFFKKKYFLIEGLVILMIFMVMFLSGLINGLERIVSSAIETMDAAYFFGGRGCGGQYSLFYVDR